MSRFLRNLNIHDIVRGTQFDVEETENLLDHVLQVEWGTTPGFLRYDHDTDSSTPIPLHPQGRDDARAYPAKPLRNQPSDIPRRQVPDYYSKAIGFEPLCFELDMEATPLVPAGMSDRESFGEDHFVLPVEGVNPPVESAVVLPTSSPLPALPRAAPQDELSYEPPVAQVDIPPGVVTVEAESPVGDALSQTSTGGVEIASSSTLPHFPALLTAAASDLRHFCRTIGITASRDIETVLREARSWAPPSARNAAVAQEGQNLKTAMFHIVQQNSQVTSQRVTADLDARYGLNLSDREASNDDISFSGESPPKKRAQLADAGPVGTVGFSGDPSPCFVPAGSNEDDGVAPAPPQ
ncbi:unnamed protein product [Agarophyton chilense]